ncbi:NUDIX domain-containing protein [Photobacterium sp. CAU 1568]|uniref:NUDIX domain-containing protein n=1 Tax=Photobacterium arenosum TaxID=2774143 RepID=A0ABR9BGG2_9GAMM|nr:NUDIX domain-containing protein [Photobacterium arenosum]MBD8511652.1 NUDIX domain-containing protein [Photobacterium arenosum]
MHSKVTTEVARLGLHYASRALIEVQGKVLLVKRVGEAFTFLPGGHVDAGEAAVQAVAREIREETGLTAEIGDLIGIAENDWQQNGQHQTEVALVFRARLAGIDVPAAVVSKEPHLEFIWADKLQLDTHHLHPVALRDIVRNDTGQYQGFVASDLA